MKMIFKRTQLQSPFLIALACSLFFSAAKLHAQNQITSPEQQALTENLRFEATARQPTTDGNPNQLGNDSFGEELVLESPSNNLIQPTTTPFSVGYENAFVISGPTPITVGKQDDYQLRINGWAQLRHTATNKSAGSEDLNQFQLKRARIIFSGSTFTRDLEYHIQLDGRSTSGDIVRLLDYYLAYDVGHHDLNLENGVLGLRAGRFKTPFTLARALSGREFEFSDRSMASTFFDVNRSLAVGAFGRLDRGSVPVNWEAAVFNGLVTGGAETGSSGKLDTNFGYSARLFANPGGAWGTMELADWEWHTQPTTRFGVGVAHATNNKKGMTEFDSIRVVDSGEQLSHLFPATVTQYDVNLYSIDGGFKFRGWSGTMEYYFRTIQGIQGADFPDFFDHGFWLQLGKFVVPQKFELAARWSRVEGNSGTLGVTDQSSEEIAAAAIYYFRKQNAKFTIDATHLNGATINSQSLDISPGDVGWLFRSQIQFAF